MEQRWWLWEWPDGTHEIHPHDVRAPGLVKCTEVRLVPVKDDAIRGNVVFDDDGLVTLRVTKGSLEEAIYRTRRGERWETEDGYRFCIASGRAVMQRVGYATPSAVVDGWHRVEEPLKCPECGYECTNTREDTRGNIQIVCDRCGVRGPVAVRESEAREAFRRMGGGR